jgi:chemotaxis signal transduction protein
METKLLEMRRRFDEAFASPPPAEAAPLEGLIAITAAGERLAIRLRDISGLSAVRGKILAVPSSVPELTGITAIRGDIVPLFSLARLLGLGGQEEDARWIVLAGEGEALVGFCFQSFDGYLQVAPAGIFTSADLAGHPHVSQTARHNGVLHGIVDLASMAEQVRSPRQPSAPK